MTLSIGQWLHQKEYPIDGLLTQEENRSRLGAISERQTQDSKTQVNVSQPKLAAYHSGESPEETIH